MGIVEDLSDLDGTSPTVLSCDQSRHSDRLDHLRFLEQLLDTGADGWTIKALRVFAKGRRGAARVTAAAASGRGLNC